MTASCILFVLFGPVPVKRKVTIVPRHAPPDVFGAQPVIRPSQLTPAVALDAATALEFSPRGETPQPLPRSRSARGTSSPPRHGSSSPRHRAVSSSPRHRVSQDEEMQTDRVARVSSDTDSFLVDGR
jgi:hypothetical protein